MPQYAMVCLTCSFFEDIFRQRSEGAPKDMRCEFCDEIMVQDYSQGAGFILKGNDWPSKEFKREKQPCGLTAEKADQEETDYQDARKELAHVDTFRRQGRKASKKFAEDNPAVMKRYWENVGKGMKPKGSNDKKKKG